MSERRLQEESIEGGEDSSSSSPSSRCRPRQSNYEEVPQCSSRQAPRAHRGLSVFLSVRLSVRVHVLSGGAQRHQSDLKTGVGVCGS